MGIPARISQPSPSGKAGFDLAGGFASNGYTRLAGAGLISVPVTNTSVNPARGTGPAVFVGGWALAQLWMFWVAPLVGTALAGIGYRAVAQERS